MGSCPDTGMDPDIFLSSQQLANVLMLWGEFSFWSHMGMKGLKWRKLFAFEV